MKDPAQGIPRNMKETLKKPQNIILQIRPVQKMKN